MSTAKSSSDAGVTIQNGSEGGVEKSLVTFLLAEGRGGRDRLLASSVAYYVEESTRRLKTIVVSITSEILEADKKIVLAGRARESKR